MPKKLKSIHDTLPDKMVKIGGFRVGQMRYEGYNKNNLWIENHSGEGCEVPLYNIEKVIEEEFKKHF